MVLRIEVLGEEHLRNLASPIKMTFRVKTDKGQLDVSLFVGNVYSFSYCQFVIGLCILWFHGVMVYIFVQHVKGPFDVE